MANGNHVYLHVAIYLQRAVTFPEFYTQLYLRYMTVKPGHFTNYLQVLFQAVYVSFRYLLCIKI